MAKRDKFCAQLFELRYRCGVSQGAIVQRFRPASRLLLSVGELKPPAPPAKTVERIAAALTLAPLETEALLAALA
jgi:hypothetical protein